MATQVQYRRGTASENNAFTGALAELTVDTTNWTIRVHDGVSAGGGGNVATVAYVTAQLAALSANAITYGTSNVQIPASGSNVRVNVAGTSNVAVFATDGIYVTANVSGGNILTAGIMSSTGNATHGNLTVSTGTVTLGNIVNANGNAVGNIGSASAYFNTIFGKATTAQYADLAELYAADAEYLPGTVLSFGGSNEVTISTVSSDARVAGVVSTNPAHLMNSTLDGEHKVAVALTGRVPTSVTGTVRKGDMMVSAGNGHAQACATPVMGTVIGKALQDFDGVSGVIEVVVGRL